VIRIAAAGCAALCVAGCSVFAKTQSVPAVTAAAPPAHVDVLEAGHGWEMTSTGLRRSTDGGRTWTRVTGLPAINYVWGTLASFPSSDAAWVCEQGRARGSTPGTIGDMRTATSPPARCFATGDGGTSWAGHDIPESGTTSGGSRRDDTTVNSVFALDGRVAWIVLGTLDTFAGGGQESINLTDVRLLATTDAGAAWSVKRDEPASSRGSLVVPGAEWVSVGASGAVYVSGFGASIDRSVDAGRSWTSLRVPLPAIGAMDESQYCSITESRDSLLVTIREVVSDVSQAFYELSTDGGARWSAGAGPPSPAAPLC
jgi:hypothetical protein